MSCLMETELLSAMRSGKCFFLSPVAPSDLQFMTALCIYYAAIWPPKIPPLPKALTFSPPAPALRTSAAT